MAAELGTMRVTEQIDALASMGANPIHYLVVPRFLGCLLLIPALTIMADFMGIVGGAFYGVQILEIDWHHYWINSQHYVRGFDVFCGHFQEPVLRGGDRADQLLPGVSLRPGGRGRRPGSHEFVRLLVRDDPPVGPCAGDRAERRLLPHLARGTQVLLTVIPWNSPKRQVPGSQEPLIRLDNLSVEFGRHLVLREVNVEIRRGETVAVIGESGCGQDRAAEDDHRVVASQPRAWCTSTARIWRP